MNACCTHPNRAVRVGKTQSAWSVKPLSVSLSMRKHDRTYHVHTQCDAHQKILRKACGGLNFSVDALGAAERPKWTHQHPYNLFKIPLS